MQIHPSRIGIVLVKFLLVGAEFYLPVENFLVGRELFTGGEYVCWSNIFFFYCSSRKYWSNLSRDTKKENQASILAVLVFMTLFVTIEI